MYNPSTQHNTSNKSSTYLIQTNISLKDKNWFQTGGSAKFFCEPKNSSEFKESLSFANQKNLNIFVLGEGANILVSDDGFDGLVIRPKNNEFTILDENQNYALIRACSGVKFQNLINWCLENNYYGLEEFSGIPGTVGGAIFINIHYFEFLLENFLFEAEVINKKTCEIFKVNKDWFNFGYNKSKLQSKEHFLINATFKLKKGSLTKIAYAKGKRDEIIRHRTMRYPQSRTCGSFFRNFFEHEVQNETSKTKLIYIAYYLDKIGVKGVLSYNDAKVSYQHANMIVNQGNAKSQDIIELAKEMQKLVQNKFGILPQPECQLIGFKAYPLLK